MPPGKSTDEPLDSRLFTLRGTDLQGTWHLAAGLVKLLAERIFLTSRLLCFSSHFFSFRHSVIRLVSIAKEFAFCAPIFRFSTSCCLLCGPAIDSLRSRTVCEARENARRYTLHPPKTSFLFFFGPYARHRYIEKENLRGTFHAPYPRL